MYKLAIWSFSNHFQNKVYPSIKNNKNIKIKYILTKKINKNKDFKNVKWLKNKDELKSKKDIDFVYISSRNSDHFKNIKFALQNKINVICEKPICLKTSQLRRLVKISKINKVRFFEMIQYKHHPLFLKLKTILKKKLIGNIKKVESEFKIPLKEKDNFRFSEKMGGGAINDVGFYPLSIMFTLFNSKKINILKKKIIKENRLDIKGDLTAKNENKVLFKLAWGFKSLYKNYITIIGANGKIEVKFIFSKKIIQNAEIKFLYPKNKILKIKRANQIDLAFNDILKSDSNYYKDNLNLSFSILKTIEILKRKQNIIIY